MGRTERTCPPAICITDHAAMEYRSGDMPAVWRLDRLGRSLKHLIELMAELEAERLGFQSVTESIATTTPRGKLVFH
jgi:DNA invertase Pin-like site-specific DNA recombinase